MKQVSFRMQGSTSIVFGKYSFVRFSWPLYCTQIQDIEKRNFNNNSYNVTEDTTKRWKKH